jgi:microcystin-dependent protein
MAEPFLSEIRIVSFDFPPKGWAYANGQMMPIAQNQALFSLLGTNFGGDGRTTFGLPDYKARAPMHVGSRHKLGERAGERDHTLTIAEMPPHVHIVNAVDTNDSAANTNNPAENFFSNSKPANLYQNGRGNMVALGPETIQPAGDSLAHSNMQPYLVLNFCVALTGIFPSPN